MQMSERVFCNLALNPKIYNSSYYDFDFDFDSTEVSIVPNTSYCLVLCVQVWVFG